jgi:hypothetical protein
MAGMDLKLLGACRCVAAYAGKKETWRCLFAEHVLPYVSTVPFFVINSLYDPAAMVPSPGRSPTPAP